jgi:glycosyltransferase involved in cell wall biosynthesis
MGAAVASSDTPQVFQTPLLAPTIEVRHVAPAGATACDDGAVGEHRVAVVSHASVLATNRSVYAELQDSGVDVELVVPARWRNEYAPRGFGVDPPGALGRRVHPRRVVGKGHAQRHAYLVRASSLLGDLAPSVVLIEEEPFSIAARQWSRAARRRGIPYGVQVAETLGRHMPGIVAHSRRDVLAHASFVVARSPSAAALAVAWGAVVEPDVVAHDVAPVAARPVPEGGFTIAFVGRLVEEKGIGDLLDATASLEGVRLLVAGAGPLADRVAAASGSVEYLGPVDHDAVGAVYARAHVTCVPSRTTSAWEEQFGRVVVESLVREVPVVATATGGLPWVLSTTGGGVLVAERDPAALAGALAALRDEPSTAVALGQAGRRGVLASFATPVVATTLAGVLARVSDR